MYSFILNSNQHPNSTNVVTYIFTHQFSEDKIIIFIRERCFKRSMNVYLLVFTSLGFTRYASMLLIWASLWLALATAFRMAFAFSGWSLAIYQRKLSGTNLEMVNGLKHVTLTKLNWSYANEEYHRWFEKCH